MTFAIFIVLILGVFVALLNILPSASSFPIDAGSTIATLAGYAKTFDSIFPIHELFLLILAVITFEVAVWVWHVSWKVIKFIRGHSDGA